MHCTFHSSIRNHAENAGLEPSVESCHGLVLVNQLGTSQYSIVGAGRLEIESHFQHLPLEKRKTTSINLQYMYC